MRYTSHVCIQFLETCQSVAQHSYTEQSQHLIEKTTAECAVLGLGLLQISAFDVSSVPVQETMIIGNKISMKRKILSGNFPIL